MFGSFRDDFEIILGYDWDHVGIIVGTIVEPCLDSFGPLLGRFLDSWDNFNFGIILVGVAQSAAAGFVLLTGSTEYIGLSGRSWAFNLRS